MKGASSANTEVIGIKGKSTSSYTEDENIGIWGRAGNADWFNAGIVSTVEGSSGNRWGGHFNGNVYTTGIYSSSDERLKKNIHSVDNEVMLAAIMQLTPSRFQFLTPDELQQQGLPRLVASEGEQLGLLAQNLEALFPELVLNVVNPHEYNKENGGERRSMTKAVKYDGLIPVLIAGMQEQQNQIEELEARITALENMMQE